MKNVLLAYAIIGACLSTIGNVSADLIWDSFEEADTSAPFPGNSGGQGWNSDWTGSKYDRVETKSLAYTRGKLHIDGGKQAVRLSPTVDNRSTDNNKALITRSFASTATPLYMAFLFRYEGTPSATDEFIAVQLGAASKAVGDPIPSFEIFHRKHPTNGYCFGLRIGKQLLQLPAPTKANETYLVVAKFSQTLTGRDPGFNRLELFLNPDSDQEPSRPDLTLTAREPIPYPQAIALRYALFTGNNATYWIDWLRLAPDWPSLVSSGL